MKIGIVGAGANGTLFGYQLAAHNEVTMLEVRRDLVPTRDRRRLAVEPTLQFVVAGVHHGLFRFVRGSVIVGRCNVRLGRRDFIAEEVP